MDANSKSDLWFSQFSEARGIILNDFICSRNLFIVNEDCGPTFRTSRGSSYIDVTVVGTDLLPRHFLLVSLTVIPYLTI